VDYSLEKATFNALKRTCVQSENALNVKQNQSAVPVRAALKLMQSFVFRAGWLSPSGFPPAQVFVAGVEVKATFSAVVSVGEVKML
jgi:hypothetical protein